jgi:hypothetical protein
MKELKLVSSAMSIFVILGMLWLAAAKDFPPVHDVGFWIIGLGSLMLLGR